MDEASQMTVLKSLGITSSMLFAVSVLGLSQQGIGQRVIQYLKGQLSTVAHMLGEETVQHVRQVLVDKGSDFIVEAAREYGINIPKDRVMQLAERGLSNFSLDAIGSGQTSGRFLNENLTVSAFDTNTVETKQEKSNPINIIGTRKKPYINVKEQKTNSGGIVQVKTPWSKTIGMK